MIKLLKKHIPLIMLLIFLGIESTLLMLRYNGLIMRGIVTEFLITILLSVVVIKYGFKNLKCVFIKLIMIFVILIFIFISYYNIRNTQFKMFASPNRDSKIMFIDESFFYPRLYVGRQKHVFFIKVIGELELVDGFKFSLHDINDIEWLNNSYIRITYYDRPFKVVYECDLKEDKLIMIEKTKIKDDCS